MNTERLVSLLFLIVCMGATPASADVLEIDNVALAKLQDEGATIIDVRRAEEWKMTGMLEGSHGITFFDKTGKYDINSWLEQFRQVVASADESVVLICASGVRSSRIAKLLDQQLGYTAVHNVEEGIIGWITERRPVAQWKP
ncbi:MAG: rhodanese-like domain-containing protein [Granulosicoccus sp.]